MKLTTQPTNMSTLKTFRDKVGNDYELRGQKNLYSLEGCFKSNYFELYKRGSKSREFVKVGAKEEICRASYYGFEPSSIKKEKYCPDGSLAEESEIFKKLNGYDIECHGKSISMNGPLRVIHAKDQYGKPFTKAKLPDHLNINGFKPLTAMAKRIMKLLQHVK